MKTRIARILAVIGISMLAVILSPAAPASAVGGGASVTHPECTFEPGDVPGVDVFFPGECTLIETPSGVTTIVAKGQLPEGYALTETFVGTLPCFGGTGMVTATVSGQVIATCHFGP